MNINWKVRIRNHQFWISVIPALALVIQAVAAVFGWSLDFTSLIGKLIGVVDAVFVLLVILGIVVDPTTAGVSDSRQAMWGNGNKGTALLVTQPGNDRTVPDVPCWGRITPLGNVQAEGVCDMITMS